MSPEQIAAGRIKVDHRTDVYSLGVVLYEMLTMQRPFPGESREEILNGVLTKEPRSPRRINAKIPVDLETICLKALEKEPDRRYATAAELANDLRQYLQHGLIAARRAGMLLRTAKWTRRHPLATTVIAAALVVIAASVVAWQMGGRGEEAQRLVADARLALREGVYRDGLQLIDRAVKLDPDSIGARLVRARLLIVNYRMREAADVARSVLQTDPQNYAAHAILAGLALYPEGQYRLVGIDPEPHVRVVEASAPESAEAYYLRALDTKDARRRIELLDRALDLNPGDQLASVARMRALGGLKDFELELSEADRLIATRPKSAQGWRMKASTYRQQRDFENARTAIERAMVIDDLDPWNYVSRSKILWEIGEHDNALSDLNRAIELDPGQASLYFHRAKRFNDAGRFEEAIVDARKAIELNPDLLPGFWELHRSYTNLYREDELRALVDELLARVEGWFDIEAKVDALHQVVYGYRRLKEYDRAMETIERAIEIDPGDYWSFIVRMTIHKDLGNDDAVRSDCDAAVRIEIDRPGDLYNRAVSMGGGGNYCDDLAGALRDYERVIELAPRWHLGYIGRGYVHAELGHLDRALADNDRAVELAPLHPWSYRRRAGVYRRLGRNEEALADLEKSVELDPHYSSGWRGYGNSLFSLGRLDEALAAHEKASALPPDMGQHALAHRDRARTLAWLGKCEEAATGYRRSAELALTTSSAIMAEAHLFAFYYNCPDEYDLNEAFRHALSAYEDDPEHQRATLAWALFRNGDYAEAKRMMLQSYEEKPEDTWFELAMCLWHLGEKAEARRFYDLSVTWMEARQPDNPSLIRQRQEATELLGIQP
jgi:tetratricopeptide (TPR) repeat protein